ncbi:unnamed protein product [Penicillium pancosmium]
MCKLALCIHSLATVSLTTNAFPRETTRDGWPLPLVPATAAPAAPMVTEAPNLRCSDGSTFIHTTDCTMGTPVAYCFKPLPPIAFSPGYFPSVWHPGHCLEESTCWPIGADWITTECHNGAYPFTTSTLYEGTIADGDWTAISIVSCACPTYQWYSMTMLEDRSNYVTFCMPHRSCPPGMTTSVRTNQYCATAAAGACADTEYKTDYCECADPMQIPVYDDDFEGAIGCE